MTKKLNVAVEILLSHLSENPHGIPISKLKQRLMEKEEIRGFKNHEEIVNQAIEYALQEGLIDKVIDSPRYEDDIPIGLPTWLLKKVDEEETEFLSNLSEVKQEYLRLLRSTTNANEIGMLKEEDVIKKLQERGFDVERAPHVSGRTQIIFDYNGEEPIRWCRLIPEFERTEEFKQSIRELEEKNLREMDRHS